MDKTLIKVPVFEDMQDVVPSESSLARGSYNMTCIYTFRCTCGTLRGVSAPMYLTPKQECRLIACQLLVEGGCAVCNAKEAAPRDS